MNIHIVREHSPSVPVDALGVVRVASVDLVAEGALVHVGLAPGAGEPGGAGARPGGGAHPAVETPGAVAVGCL